MRRTATLLTLSVLLAAALLASSMGALAASAPTKSGATTTTEPPTTLPFTTVAPTSAPPDGAGPAPAGHILMVKLYVGDLAKAEKFYGAVFGANPALKLGATAHIVTFPAGGPGLVLLKKKSTDTSKYGAFIMQVPDLEAARALAVANGAKEQGHFAGSPGGSAAKSIDMLDPWGNNVEILQIG